MLIVEGTYKDGKVELSDAALEIREARVLVTFLLPGDIDLRAHGISEEQAAELRAAFATFADWNDPAMDVYNDYDAAKAALESKA